MMNPINQYQNLATTSYMSQTNQSMDLRVNVPISASADQGNASSAGVSGHKNKFISGQEAQVESLSNTYDEKTLKRMGIVECATCASRTYVDGSDDPGVSFKTPTHVSPGQSLQAVVGHEMEHVSNEQASAENQGGEVISQTVSIHMSTCPECGKSYAAGGVTRTTTSIPIQQNAIEPGQLVDMKL